MLCNECAQSEQGAAAILASQMDAALGGGPRQYRETQGSESTEFMSYFPSGVKYKKGGVASGFRQVVINEVGASRLLQVKGRRAVRAWEVDMNWSSFTNNDCYIIDLGKNIYQWCGSKCNRYERLKSTTVSISIRDDERGGGGSLFMIDEGDEPEEVIQVLGPKPDIPDALLSDKEADEDNKNLASLYKYTDESGSMVSSLVAESPLKQAQLLLSECYLLDNPTNKMIFIWKGTDASTAERSAALDAAQRFIIEKKYPTQTRVDVMAAGAESTLFKEFFCDWKDKYDTTGPGKAYVLGTIAKVEQIPFDATTLHTQPTMAAQYSMADDGSGEVKIWRVEESEKVEVDRSTYGKFFGGDCYLILYTYKVDRRERHIIYMWQGRKSSKTELTASAFLAVTLDQSMGGSPVQVRVTQGQEPPHLVSLFKENPLLIFLGGTSRGEGQSQPGSTRLFHIRRSTTGVARAVEVEPTAAALNTNDIFVLKSPSGLFMWRGLGSDAAEEAAAKYVAKYLGGSLKEVKEGSESDDFWSALGGKTEYQTSKSLQKILMDPRLFGCSNKTGRLIAEEVPAGFTQLDLATDDVMILDTWDEIFLWVGSEANDVEKKGAPKIATDYLAADPYGRGDIPVSTIQQGSEPLSFTGWFQAWDPKTWDKIMDNFS